MPRAQLLALRQKYECELHGFTASSKTFEVLDTLATPTYPPEGEIIASKTPPLSTLYVLDSSFNPPTLAHFHIAKSALTSSTSPTHDLRSVKLLLLLATQNADKPAKPALFEDRLVMMNLFARDLLASISQHRNVGADGGLPTVDIGVTSRPYFIDKASSIAASGVYDPPDVQQVHLTGYDTLIRIFEPKYYLPAHTLEPLGPFLEKHRLRVTMRPDDAWGQGAKQRMFLEELRDGGLEAVKGRREWAERIEMVDGMSVGEGGDGAVSSTRARQLASKDAEGLSRLVTESVAQYVLDGGFYAEY